MEIKVKDTTILYNDGNLSIKRKDKIYQIDPTFKARIILNNDRDIYFEKAKNIKVNEYISGVGKGIRVSYSDIKGVNFAFDTLVWIEESSQDVYFEWIVINDNGFDIKEIDWPGYFKFDQVEGYSLIPYMQGVLLPNDYPMTWEGVPFDGQLCSSAAYMPWLAQVCDNQGYIMINTTPWDARYVVKHEYDRIGTQVSMRWLTTLNKMNYKRVLRYSFLDHCDYNDICKVYKKYVKENTQFKTLEEKCIQNNHINDLIGSAFIHSTIKRNVNKDSSFYDINNINNKVSTFKEKEQLLLTLKEKGVNKMYLHLDGWGKYGYDNAHPDIFPVCEEANGVEGLKQLSNMMKQNKWLLGLHDQYRDYYKKAKTYDQKFALQDADGGYYEHSRWAGGSQNYLCASLAKGYLKRNMEQLFKDEIYLDASYLDVFTCNELDECSNPLHKMTRKECAYHREECFQYLLSNHILTSSEECSDYAMNSLVFTHYGPYEFMLKNNDKKRLGIAIPLFNLVYHECIILAWPMDIRSEDYMLYALLNGGAAYLIREGAYPNTDGTFYIHDDLTSETKIKRYQIVADLQEKVAKKEMIKHEFIDGDYDKQRTYFSDGSEVTINLKSGDYIIK